jgi:hypothetical protein
MPSVQEIMDHNLKQAKKNTERLKKIREDLRRKMDAEPKRSPYDILTEYLEEDSAED